VEDCADLPWLEARDQPAGLVCRDSDKVNVSARGLGYHLGHDRQVAVGPGADDQPGSAPREVLVGRERGVSELGAVWLGGFLAPFAHGTSVDDDVVLVRLSLYIRRRTPTRVRILYLPPQVRGVMALGGQPLQMRNAIDILACEVFQRADRTHQHGCDNVDGRDRRRDPNSACRCFVHRCFVHAGGSIRNR